MHLIRLEIDNFRVIRQARIDFPDSVTAIVGPNGAGKSSIIEAITWVLYGSPASRTSESGIRATFASADQPCRVSLEFSINDDRYRIERRLVGRTDKAEVALFRNSASESVGVRETVQYVGSLLGLDFRAFRTSFLARQQELNALSDLVPSQRQNHLAGMLGIERLDKIIKRVKDDTKTAKARSETLDDQIRQWSQVADRVGEMTEKVGALAGRAKRANEEAGAARVAQEKAADQFKKWQEIKATWQVQKGTLEAEERSSLETINRLQAARQEEKSLKEARSELDEANRKLVELPALTERLNQLLKAESELARKEATAKKLKAEQNERQKAENELADLLKQSEQIKTEQKKIPDDIAEQRAAAQKKLEEARQSFADLNAIQSNRQADIEQLQKQVGAIETIGDKTVCDRCGRPFGDDIEAVREHIGQEIERLEKAHRAADTELAELRKDGAERREKFEQLEKLVRNRTELTAKLENLDQTIKRLKAQVESAAKRCDELSDEVRALSKVSFDPKTLAEVKANKEALEQVRTKAAQLQGRLERLPQLEQEISELVKRSETAAGKIADLKKKLTELQYDETAFEKAKAKLNEEQQNFEQKQKESISVSKEYELAERELDHALRQAELLKKSKEEAEKLREDHYYGEKIAGLMADFRKHVIARIRPTLASFAGDLVRQMTADRYSLVELDAQYNLRLMDSGEFYDIERFSGGEKDLANLCLRLAISQALTESAGMNQSFIILDEVFGSQDAERRQLIVDALAGLKRSFNQIILITHIEEIKDSVEDLINVRPTGEGWSEVSMGGNGNGTA